jgi:hypothetical protein
MSASTTTSTLEYEDGFDLTLDDDSDDTDTVQLLDTDTDLVQLLDYEWDTDIEFLDFETDIELD